MVPPGASFEFFMGPRYRARVSAIEGLHEAVVDAVCDNFDRLQRIGDDQYAGELHFQERSFGFIISRFSKNKVSLQLLWDKVNERSSDDAIIAEFQRRRLK